MKELTDFKDESIRFEIPSQLVKIYFPSLARISVTSASVAKLMRFNSQLKSYFTVNFLKIRRVEIILPLRNDFDLLRMPLIVWDKRVSRKYSVVPKGNPSRQKKGVKSGSWEKLEPI